MRSCQEGGEENLAVFHCRVWIVNPGPNFSANSSRCSMMRGELKRFRSKGCFDRAFESIARRSRAEFASKAMAIREVLIDEAGDKHAAIRIHKASKRAL